MRNEWEVAELSEIFALGDRLVSSAPGGTITRDAPMVSTFEAVVALLAAVSGTPFNSSFAATCAFSSKPLDLCPLTSFVRLELPRVMNAIVR